MKAIIFDADGMVIEGERFSDRYQREFNISNEEMMSFFKGAYGDCALGKADLKEAVKPFLKKWKWEKSVEEFLDYWFFDYRINKEMIEEIERLKKLGVKCCLATNQEKHRLEYLKEEMGLGEVFDKIYSSSEIGYKKPSREFFQFVLEDLKKEINIELKEIIFWDNEEKNVLSGSEFGFESYVYKGIENFKKIV
jgi:putative hydrolase of the HAD superfamily